MRPRGTHLVGFGLHTRLGRGLPAHAAALARASEATLALPAALRFELGDGPLDVPYHLFADAPLGEEGRFFRVLDGVVADAIADSGLSPSELRRAALFVGSSSSEIGVVEDIFKDDLAADPAAVPLRIRSGMANLEWRLRERFGFGPEGGSVNTACTASSNALIMADAGLRAGLYEHAVVVGVEIFNVTTALGFRGLELLSRGGMRPFDDRRDGLILGEGCAAVLLSREASAQNGLRFVVGAGVIDTHSISSPAADGSTIADVVARTLAAAGASPADVQGIKAHATASLLNDDAEAAGLRAVFGEPPPLCVLKPYVGHTFGACGLVELAMLEACLREGFWPSAPGVAAEPGKLQLTLPQKPQAAATGLYLLSTFGFGGSNVCLAVMRD
jgi:3-oxoacyl-[acyl-carrier-protein] synthase-1